MKMPLISVIIPVYNGEDFIPVCIESLLNMDYPSDKFEIIIVDNNSTDGTADVVRRYPVRYIFESIKGPSAARNTGARVARGNILAFTDVDVIVEKNWLFEIEKNFTNQDIDAVMGVCKGINRNIWAELGQRYYEIFVAQRKSEGKNLRKIDTKNFAIRKAVFLESGGFDNNFMNSEDLEFGLRLYDRGYKTVFSSGVKINHINASELGTIINARREQSFYDYKIAQRYDEESNKEYFPSLSRWRYRCIFLKNRKVEKPILVILNYMLPIFIRLSVLLLKVPFFFGVRKKLYPVFSLTLGLATIHGKILSRSVERGYLSMNAHCEAKIFKRQKIF